MHQLSQKLLSQGNATPALKMGTEYNSVGPMMIRWIEILRGMTGWWRAVTALIAGITAALSLPPLDFWPLLFVAVPVILALLESLARRDLRKAFMLGWWFGFGYFLLAFHWIGFAFLVDKKDYLC